ncbi:MAG TPA: type II toxin-antitoxin system PemK/MazF family toxin [Egibacteraceae bacterium]|nr:type II toxin-antitoxin system PemK/MazF family toxin [Egibacteraceae bacterium]
MVARPGRGDVWWLEDPDVGRRPALVLTRDAAIPVLTWLLAAPITRTVRSIPTEVPLDADDGMPEPCAVTLDNVRPVRPSLLTARITTLGPERMQAVCDALRTAVAC